MRRGEGKWRNPWENDDAGWEHWVTTHPAGFMANTRRPVGGSYFKTHRTNCRLPDRSKLGSVNPRTGNGYLKITADTIAELHEWAKEKLKFTPGPSDYCKRCAP
jgi:hypothetical protein